MYIMALLINRVVLSDSRPRLSVGIPMSTLCGYEVKSIAAAEKSIVLGAHLGLLGSSICECHTLPTTYPGVASKPLLR